MNCNKRRHVRRRLVLFIASVLPLFADDVVVPHESPVRDNEYDDDHNNVVRRRQQMSDHDDVYALLPLHIMNHRITEQQEHNHDPTRYRKFYRKYIDGNQQWVEQVWLPNQIYNGSTVRIPYYPFTVETDRIDTKMQDGIELLLSDRKLNRTGGEDVQSNANLQKVESQIQDHDTTSTSNSFIGDDAVVATASEAAATAAAAAVMSENDSTTTQTTPTSVTTTTTTTTTPQSDRIKHVEVDYASKSAGAVILDSSPNFQGVSNLLQQDRDKYAIVPCSTGTNTGRTTSTEPKYVVIGLSEDILVKQFAIANYERYSSHMKEIRLFGSVSTNAIRQQSHWIHLGDYIAQPNTNNSDKQTFDLSEPTWARYLKVEFISHYGEEYYCTISQISVHGSTVLQGFHEQWNEENENDSNNIVAAAGSTAAETASAVTYTTTATTNSTNSAIEDKTDILNQVDSTHDGSSGTPLVGTNSNKRMVVETNKQTEINVNFIGDKSTVSTRSRYNFSRITGCRSSSSFEENLMYYSSHSNKDVSELEENGSSNSTSGLSTPLSFRQSRSSLTNLCSTTTKTTLMPKQSIRRVQIRHAPRTPEVLTNAVLPRPDDSSNVPNRPLSKLSLGLERVTDFLRGAIEGFNTSKMPNNLHHIKELDSAIDELNVIPMKYDGIRDGDMESDIATNENVKADNHGDVEELLEFNRLLIPKLLKRIPSAKCLENLNFADHKSNLKTASSKPKNGSNGGPTSSNGGSGGGGNNGASSSMEPIFKKLTDEIKSLQANVAVHDQFTKDALSCYQRVMFEMLLEMEADRQSWDARIAKLENEMYSATLMMAWQRWTTRILTTSWNYYLASIPALLHIEQSGNIDGAVSLLSLVALLVFGATCMSLLFLMKVIRRRRKKCTTIITNQQNGINIVKDNTISFQYTNHHTSEDDDDSSAEILPLSPMEHPLVSDKENGVLGQ